MASTTRFVILSHGRSGSTLLVDLLRSHPAIDCQDEVLNENRWHGRWRPVGWLVREYPALFLEWQTRRAKKPVYGFKLKTGGQVHNLGRSLRNLHHYGWRLIRLYRRDALQQTFSWMVAQATDRWQRTDSTQMPPQRVTLDPAKFLRDLHTCVSDCQSLADLLLPLPHLALTYEDNLADSAYWTDTSARICTFLGVPPAPLTSRIVKTWERPYVELVTNYDEIARLAECALPTIESEVQSRAAGAVQP